MIASNLQYRVGEVYGNVVFQLAVERQQLEAVKADFDEIDNFMFHEGDFLTVMESPFLSVEQKALLVDRLFAGKFSELTLSLLASAGVRNRLSALPNIIKKFNKLYRKSKGHKDIWMTVAYALDQNEIDSVKTSLAASLNTNTENITLEFNVEPNIIGGAIIRHSGKMVDNSIRTRLNHAVDTVISRGRNLGKSV